MLISVVNSENKYKLLWIAQSEIVEFFISFWEFPLKWGKTIFVKKKELLFVVKHTDHLGVFQGFILGKKRTR